MFRRIITFLILLSQGLALWPASAYGMDPGEGDKQKRATVSSASTREIELGDLSSNPLAGSSLADPSAAPVTQSEGAISLDLPHGILSHEMRSTENSYPAELDPLLALLVHKQHPQQRWQNKEFLHIPASVWASGIPVFAAQSMVQHIFLIDIQNLGVPFSTSKAIALLTAIFDSPATVTLFKRHIEGRSIPSEYKNSLFQRLACFLLPSLHPNKTRKKINPFFLNGFYYASFLMAVLVASAPTYILYNDTQEYIKKHGEPKSYIWVNLPQLPFFFLKNFWMIHDSLSRISYRVMNHFSMGETQLIASQRKKLLRDVDGVIENIILNESARKKLWDLLFKQHDAETIPESQKTEMLQVVKTVFVDKEISPEKKEDSKQPSKWSWLVGQKEEPIMRRILGGIGNLSGPAATFTNYMIGSYVTENIIQYIDPTFDTDSITSNLLEGVVGIFVMVGRGGLETLATKSVLRDVYDYCRQSHHFVHRHHTTMPKKRIAIELYSFAQGAWLAFPMIILGVSALSDLSNWQKVLSLTPFALGEASIQIQRIALEHQRILTGITKSKLGKKVGIVPDPESQKRDVLVKWLRSLRHMIETLPDETIVKLHEELGYKSG